MSGSDDEFGTILAFMTQAAALSRELGEQRMARLLLDFLILMEVTEYQGMRCTLAQIRNSI
jgi:hypothetical protein